ncbi:MAG TPA: hypothetical protein VL326_29835 [Kofleriaceae bacterium]|nr:hypothetical protein [Kofleriaceae bacterium]
MEVSEFSIGDTTERSMPDVLTAIPDPVAPEDTDVFVRPRGFPRPSSMYPMVSIEDLGLEDQEADGG